MRVRRGRSYVLFINGFTNMAFWGCSGAWNDRISRATLGTIFDCTFSELRANIRNLKKRGFSVYSRSE